MTVNLRYIALGWLIYLHSIQSTRGVVEALGVVAATRASLLAELQRCQIPSEVLDRIGRHVTPAIDPDGSLSSLILVRLSKQLVSVVNNNANSSTAEAVAQFRRGVYHESSLSIVTNCLASADFSNVDALVEGTKACAVLSRLLPPPADMAVSQPLASFWRRHGIKLIDNMQDHHLSSVKWAFDSFQVALEDYNPSFALPAAVQFAYDVCDLPFSILPGCLLQDMTTVIPNLSVATMESEVDFRIDDIRTTASEQVVAERRQTAWQGDEGVAPFCYSGKRMPRSDWSPTVLRIRDRLHRATGQYYDGCLLNLYPDGRSGMRYHSDPDQGSLWDRDTAVVSIGATRRFAFRPIHGGQPHNFVVLHGDVTYMFRDCQERFQHAVKNADSRDETAPRVSLVFKRTWDSPIPK